MIQPNLAGIRQNLGGCCLFMQDKARHPVKMDLHIKARQHMKNTGLGKVLCFGVILKYVGIQACSQSDKFFLILNKVLSERMQPLKSCSDFLPYSYQSTCMRRLIKLLPLNTSPPSHWLWHYSTCLPLCWTFHYNASRSFGQCSIWCWPWWSPVLNTGICYLQYLDLTVPTQVRARTRWRDLEKSIEEHIHVSPLDGKGVVLTVRPGLVSALVVGRHSWLIPCWACFQKCQNRTRTKPSNRTRVCWEAIFVGRVSEIVIWLQYLGS